MNSFKRYLLIITTALLPIIAVSFTSGSLWAATPTPQTQPEVKPINRDKENKHPVPIPIPNLEPLEKVVAIQLKEGRIEAESIVFHPEATAEQKGQAYAELGNLYHAYKLPEPAEAAYRNAHLAEPTEFKWCYSLAYLLQEEGKYKEALSFYLKGQTSPTLPAQLHYLFNIRTGECHLKLNDLNNAKLSFGRAFREKPGGPAILARMGDVALMEKRYADAVNFLEAALKQQPAANQLHYSLGMAYRGLNEMEKAREHMSQMGKVGIQPPDPLLDRLDKVKTGSRVHILEGKLAFSANRFNEAAEEFRKAIAADPENVSARINLGTTLVKLGLEEEAVQHFNAAEKLEPQNETVNFNLGMLHGKNKNYTLAIDYLKKTLDKTPDDHQAMQFLAMAYAGAEQFDNAVLYYQKTLRLNPSQMEAWLALAAMLQRLNRHDEALAELEKAHGNIPFNGPIAHALARLLAMTPNLEKRDGKRALDLAMKVYNAAISFEHARTVAMAYGQLEKCNDAAEWMERAIKLAKSTQQPKPILDMLERNLNHFKRNNPCKVPGGLPK